MSDDREFEEELIRYGDLRLACANGKASAFKVYEQAKRVIALRGIPESDAERLVAIGAERGAREALEHRCKLAPGEAREIAQAVLAAYHARRETE